MSERPSWCPVCFHDLHGAWTCKRRTCPSYAPKYLRDLAEVMKSALAEWEHETTIATLTAPGSDVLPWDASLCSIEGPHKHSGPNGCSVNQWEAAKWNQTVTRRLSAICNRAAMRVRRQGLTPPTILARALELKRGVFHAHVVLGFRWSGIEGLKAYGQALDELRGEYEFGTSAHGGFDMGEPGRFSGAHAGLYASKYLRPNGAKGSFIPALILVDQVTDRNPETGRRLEQLRPVYVNPKLTTRSRITMRFLRWSRYAFIAWGRVEVPRTELLAVYEWVKFFGAELVPDECPNPPPVEEAIPF